MEGKEVKRRRGRERIQKFRCIKKKKNDRRNISIGLFKTHTQEIKSVQFHLSTFLSVYVVYMEFLHLVDKPL